jgi:hypothetical protein
MAPPDVEVEISHAVMNAKLEILSGKVDELTATVHELVAMKNKGLGAFWLASIIIAAAFTGLVSAIGTWLRGG